MGFVAPAHSIRSGRLSGRPQKRLTDQRVSRRWSFLPSAPQRLRALADGNWRSSTTTTTTVPSRSSSAVKSAADVGTAALAWERLAFDFVPTSCYVKSVWRADTNSWSPVEEVHYGPHGEPVMPVHIASTALHYGQSVFEGLKAFACADRHVRLFRPRENAARLERSARRLNMPVVPPELFMEAVQRCVLRNCEYVPPYGAAGAGGSLYVRPLLFGSGGRIGLGPADEYTFLVLVTPVGNYYRGGLAPVTAYITTEYDRAAPRGVGHVKVAGNYAADLKPSMEAKARGYPINLYLDAREQRYVEEFGTSNFAGIRYLDERGDRYVYVTPWSESVLAGITNRTLMELTQLEGMAVEHRPVTLDELGHFDEVFATGTAVVITAVDQVVRGERVIPIGRTTGSGHVGPVAQRLYRQVRAIQTGEAPDPAHWTHLVI
ncbi:hypothetical protein CDCA_CDCA08G2303 [Cyanidium caldarium]|uniref:Branched-chain-amino-acid transaminase n=1 Tax=Cyanidium caldarium TaxID=2771 RepID=A0AAV9IVG2_CYACA|nr:hypothetical protein CDCA_CDCA08G2303 [Cyanidium caldarium]